jgi:hypothetical protein
VNASSLSSMMFLSPVPASTDKEPRVKVRQKKLPRFAIMLIKLERAENAPLIRQIFSSSPRDPRYHMLSYMSSKFSQEPRTSVHEPRAALFINRFTRTLTIMFATDGLANLLGITASELKGKSFYYCIQENCLSDAVKCLESAKENDSIAYLRFWYRDPRTGGDRDDAGDADDAESNAAESDATSAADQDDDDGGVGLHTPTDRRLSPNPPLDPHHVDSGESGNSSSSGNIGVNATGTTSDASATVSSSSSSVPIASSSRGGRRSSPQSTAQRQIELEAVVSCTSDGLVVILRAARPFLPASIRAPPQTALPIYANGLFASPWANQPIVPQPFLRNPSVPESQYYPGLASVQAPMGLTNTASGPPLDDFMNSIREVAVFAWSVTGINGSLADFGRGTPRGQSIPPTGLPIWMPGSSIDAEGERHNGLYGRPFLTNPFRPSPSMTESSGRGLQSTSSETAEHASSGRPPTPIGDGAPFASAGQPSPGEATFTGFLPRAPDADVNQFWTNEAPQGLENWRKTQRFTGWGLGNDVNLLAFGPTRAERELKKLTEAWLARQGR